MDILQYGSIYPDVSYVIEDGYEFSGRPEILFTNQKAIDNYYNAKYENIN